MSLPAPAIRKNIVPLLGIAFVVAVLCTGLFYGVFASRFGSGAALPPVRLLVVAARDLPRGIPLKPEDVKVAEVRSDVAPKGTLTTREEVNGRTLVVAVAEGTPLADAMLSSAASDREIPAGMRALTIRPSDSSSVLAALQSGRRIDIQAWSERGGDPQLRTILENVEVLSGAHALDSSNPNASAITVVVPAAKADEVALADSAAHLRIMLRSADDDSSTGGARVAMTSILAGHGDLAPVRTRTVSRESSLPELNVSVLGVTDAALRKLSPDGAAALSVRGVDANGNWEQTLRQTLATREAVEVSAQRVGASHGNTIQFGNGHWRVRVRFEAEDGHVRLYPEVITQAGNAVTVRRTRGDLATGAQTSAALVSGVCVNDEDRASVAERTRAAGVNVRDLLIVVRPRASALTASLPRNAH